MTTLNYRQRKQQKRDYHYRIPKNDDIGFKLAVWELHGKMAYEGRFVVRWNEFSGDATRYIGIKTADGEGHLPGLEKYVHSARWRDAPVHTDIDEYRQANNGGTKIKGTFKANVLGYENSTETLEFETTIPETPGELEELFEFGGSRLSEIQETIAYAKDDAIDEAQEAVMKAQEECSHDRVDWDIPPYALGPHADGYCEDCHAELFH